MKTAVSSQKIVIIGAGNVATQMGKAFYTAGYTILQVYSRSLKPATTLAKKLNATPITDLKKLDQNAALFLVSVKDDAISRVAKQIKIKEQLIVHTSGTVEMNVLKKCSRNFGVFYPLQTFSKEKNVDFDVVPVCIEANNKKSISSLQSLAKSISSNIQQIDSKQRKILHLAAVFACNFTNHMYTIASAILLQHNLSFDLLKPLIAETAEKIKNGDPYKMQTGPAIRKDQKTMNAHLKLLAKDKQLKTIYKLVSDHISS